MFPMMPPLGYGDVSFDPTKPGTNDKRTPDDWTDMDEQALDALQTILPSSRR